MSDINGQPSGQLSDEAIAAAKEGAQLDLPLKGTPQQAPASAASDVTTKYLLEQVQQLQAQLAQQSQAKAPAPPAEKTAEPTANERIGMAEQEMAKLREELARERDNRFKADNRARAVQSLDANHFTDDAKSLVLDHIESRIENIDGQAMIKTEVPIAEGSNVTTTKYITPDEYIAQYAVKHPGLISADKKLGQGTGARGQRTAPQAVDPSKYQGLTRQQLMKDSRLQREVYAIDDGVTYNKIMTEGGELDARLRGKTFTK